MTHMSPATMATLCGTFHWVADRWKKQARYPEIRSFPEHYQACPPPFYNSVKKSEDEVFVAVEAVEIIIDIIEQVIGHRGDYIKELSQRWSDKIINMSFQRLRGWRNLRYQGVCTISQRIPHQYVATTFSGDPASRGFSNELQEALMNGMMWKLPNLPVKRAVKLTTEAS